MRFIIFQYYGAVESGMGPMTEWSEADVQAHIEFQFALNRELEAAGELIDGQGLTPPEMAKFVVASDGSGPPVVSDGPYPETKELVAGYRLVEVASLERALEIAALVSGAPGMGGRPVRQAIEVREVFGGPPE